MEKKTKALAAIAAARWPSGVALSVASCALRSAGTDQQTVQEEAPVEEAAQGRGAEAPAALTSYELACSKGWKSDAGSLQMSKGMVIEKGADGKIHVLTVSGVEEADAGEQAVLTVAAPTRTRRTASPGRWYSTGPAARQPCPATTSR